MGVSAEHHRAVTGCFAAKLWSSGWTPGSSGTARCNGKQGRRSWKTRGSSSSTSAGCWWWIVLLLFQMATTALPMICGPVVVSFTVQSVVNSQAVLSFRESDSRWSVFEGSSVTSPIVISNTTWLVLLLSGDVESNPGPAGGDGYEQSLVEGLAKLCRAAPSDTVRSVLGVWSPSKPGNEIRSTWQQGRRFLAPDLKGTLAWLTMIRECDIKGTKHDVAGLLLIALEALLPDTCQVCKETYCVEREDKPSLCC